VFWGVGIFSWSLRRGWFTDLVLHYDSEGVAVVA
jgi:hypothetical protein